MYQLCKNLLYTALRGLVCLVFILLFVAATPINIRYLSIDQGLSNNSVRCIYQDHYGFMWFGTYDGLNRYDGYEFRVFRNNLNDTLSLPHNYIYTISEDQHNRLWIGTGQGAVIYNRLKASFVPVYYRNIATGKREKIAISTTIIQPDSKGNVFLGTNGRGLIVLFKGSETAQQIPFGTGVTRKTAYNVTSIVTDKENRLWLFINEVGLCRYDYADRKIVLVSNVVQTASSLAAGNNSIWIGTSTGLYLYDIKEQTIAKNYTEANGKLTSNDVANLMLDKKEQLWIGTDGGGINILHTATGELDYLQPVQGVKSLSSESVFAIYEDNESRIWIGTLKGGIDVIDPLRSQFQTIGHQPLISNSLVSNFVSCFYENPDNSLLIGTDGGGLNMWNSLQNQFTSYSHQPGNTSSLSSNMVTSIIRDHEGVYWITTYGGGISRFNKARGTFQQYHCINPLTNAENKNAWLVYEDRRKTLWVTTFSSGQLYRYNRQADKFEMFAPAVFDLISFTEDAAGALWAGNSHGLIHIDRISGAAVSYDVGKPVRAIYESSKKQLWLGTEGGGLILFNRQTGQIEKRYAEINGLCNNSVLNMLEDSKGNLWLSTFNGLSKFDPGRQVFQNFYQSDGLQSNQFSYNAALKLRSGELVFGGVKGFTIFNPDSIRFKTTTHPVRLTGLRINNASVTDPANQAYIRETEGDRIKKLEIPYDQAFVSFDFAALEYSVPYKISYGYYLEGWDKTWISSSRQRTANYTRLEEGTYTLYLRSTNPKGEWSPGQAVMVISILPPWYRSWWAYLVYAGILAGLIYLYNGYRVRQAKLEYDVKLAYMDAEKEKELNEKKLSFFTDISHELRTPLTLIINPLKDFLESGTSNGSGELAIVYRNASRLLSLVDQLMQFQRTGEGDDPLKISKLDFYQLCRDVYESFISQGRSRNIDYRFEANTGELELYADREKMEIVLFNLLSNAMKFTPEGGQVVFSMVEKPDEVEVSVADNGPGVPAGVGNKLFERFYRVSENRSSSQPGFGIGLYLVKNFTDKHKGRIWYESEAGKGTAFHLVLQKGINHIDRQAIAHEEVPVDPVPRVTPAGPETTVLPETVAEEAPPAAIIVSKPKKQELDELVSGKASVLVVEDNNDILQYVKSIFETTFNVYEAENGQAGIRLAREYLPDIIISDLMMPNGTGIELCNAVKQDAALSHIPVILLTAVSTSDMKLKGLECGADDYITKPFEKELLVARVANLLKKRTTLHDYFYNEVTLQQNNLKVSAAYKEFLEKCIAIVEAHLGDDQFSVRMLSAEIGMSHSNLYKKIKAISGQSVNAFIRLIRLRKAAELFINTSMNVNETAFEVGINDVKYFRKLFSELFGVNPSEYIKQYRKGFGSHYRVNKAAFGHGASRSNPPVDNG